MKKLSNIIQFILLFMLISLVIMSNSLTNINSIFENVDELYIILIFITFVIILLSNNLKINFYKEEKKIVYSVLSLITIGCVSSYVFKYQSTQIVISELLVFLKFIVTFLLVRQIYRGFNIYKYKGSIIIICNILTIGMFLLLIIDTIWSVFPTIGYRYGLKAYSLIFTHPTYLAGFAFTMICLYTTFKDADKKKYININLILMASTLRNKAIIFIFIFILLNMINKKKIIKINRNTKVMLFILGVLAVIFIFSDAISERILDESTARNILYSKSFIIAKDHFPLGAGLGTFASYISGEYYSPLYFKYGISNIYGLTSDNFKYVADTFWPQVVSQFGFLGLLIFLIILYNLFKMTMNIKDQSIKFSSILILIYILISSTSEAIFNTYLGIGLFSILAIFINTDKYTEENYEEKSINS
ncbi:hypothetical protein L0P85_03950 [Terrisporobacter glycolicus]|nr:hypothetical protein L0P85_03950 [Terrisporobacter glycolicus]